MANLSSVLQGIPGLRGWQAQDQFRQEQMQGDQATQLNQMKLAELFNARQQHAQDQQQLQSVMAQTGGDPTLAIQALLKAGTPKSIELASKLDGLIQKPEKVNYNQPFLPNGQPNEAFQKYEASKVKVPTETPADKLAREKFEFEKSQGGKAPSGYRYTKDGGLEAIPGGPADTKELQKSSTQELGRENVSTVIAQLRDAYGQLQTGGGITDPNAS